MIPYYILIIAPLIIYLLGLYKGKKYDKACISIFFILFLILLSLRSDLIGVDLANYRFYFNRMSILSFIEVIRYSIKGEFLFFLLVKIILLLFKNNFQIFLMIVALLSIVPIFKMYYQKSNNAILTIALFITVAPFSLFFSGLRQAIALGISVFAFRFVENKKFVKYLFLVLIAYFFHRSAIFCLPIYFLYHSKITKKWLYFIVPLMLTIFIFNEQIFTFLLSFNFLYEGRIVSTGAYSILILLVLFSIYCFVFPSKLEITNEFIGLRNILLFSVIIQMFAPLHSTVMRINYYYLLYIPILIPKVKELCDRKNKRFLDMSIFLMSIFFISYFFYSAYTGVDILRIFPYIPFWEASL